MLWTNLFPFLIFKYTLHVLTLNTRIFKCILAVSLSPLPFLSLYLLRLWSRNISYLKWKTLYFNCSRTVATLRKRWPGVATESIRSQPDTERIHTWKESNNSLGDTLPHQLWWRTEPVRVPSSNANVMTEFQDSHKKIIGINHNQFHLSRDEQHTEKKVHFKRKQEPGLVWH